MDTHYISNKFNLVIKVYDLEQQNIINKLIIAYTIIQMIKLIIQIKEKDKKVIKVLKDQEYIY